MIQLCNQIIRYTLERAFRKMRITEKIKAINKKIETKLNTI